jgi:hypothetical protein
MFALHAHVEVDHGDGQGCNRYRKPMPAARYYDVAERSVSISEWTRCPVPEFHLPRRGADLPVLFEVSNKSALKAL